MTVKDRKRSKRKCSVRLAKVESDLQLGKRNKKEQVRTLSFKEGERMMGHLDKFVEAMRT